MWRAYLLSLCLIKREKNLGQDGTKMSGAKVASDMHIIMGKSPETIKTKFPPKYCLHDTKYISALFSVGGQPQFLKTRASD